MPRIKLYLSTLLLALLGVAILSSLTNSSSATTKRKLSTTVVQRSYVYWNAGLHIDAFWPEGGTPPAAGIDWEIFVHGGWWYKGSAASGDNYCAHASLAGRACFSVDYRLVPKVSWRANLEDVISDIAWVHNHASLFNLNPERGFMHGVSAGALLATTAALDDGTFAGIITGSGITDAGISYHDSNPVAMQNTINLMAGGTPSTAYSKYSDAQVFHHFSAAAPEKFLVMHAENDTTVHVGMSDTFNSKLVKAGYETTYIRYTAEQVGSCSPHTLSCIPGNLTTVDTWIASH